MKIMKTRRSSTAHSDDVAAQKVLKVSVTGQRCGVGVCVCMCTLQSTIGWT